MTEIKLENVSKKLRGQLMLENISFSVESGKVAVLLGPAKSGKSYLLRLIAGIDTPDTGRILFDGEDVTNLSPKSRGVGMVFQTFALYPHMTIYDNIASPLKINKIPQNEIKEKVNEIAELLGIKNILKRYPHECSGGEAQRVAIARALIKRPRVLLLDEPLTNLDYKIREILRIELKKILKTFNITTIYATTNAEEAAALGNILLHIRRGKIIQKGEVKECFRNPIDLEAAKLYSPYGINTLPGFCLEEGSVKKFKIIDEISLNINGINQLKTGEYLIGFYPHDISLESNQQQKNIEIPVKVLFLENTGSEIIVNLKAKNYTLRALIKEIEKIHKIGHITKVYLSINNVMVFEKNGTRVCNLG